MKEYDGESLSKKPSVAIITIKTDGTREVNAVLTVTFDPPPPTKEQLKANGGKMASTESAAIAGKMVEAWNLFCMGHYGGPVVKTVEFPQIGISMDKDEMEKAAMHNAMEIMAERMRAHDQSQHDEEDDDATPPRTKLH